MGGDGTASQRVGGDDGDDAEAATSPRQSDGDSDDGSDGAEPTGGVRVDDEVLTENGGAATTLSDSDSASALDTESEEEYGG